MAMQPSPFDLNDSAAYAAWRLAKLRAAATATEQLIVDVQDPRALSPAEQLALLQCVARNNMVVYRSAVQAEDTELVAKLGRQLGLVRLDANWLADEDGISRIAVADAQSQARSDFIPYTNRAIGWHTDGYYHPQSRRIAGMVLHCVRSAATGGENRLADHELVYIALRDANPAWIVALQADDAMTIPEREDEQGVARAAQSGPVFGRLAADTPWGEALHMRYTARTRSIVWKDDTLTRQAAAALQEVLQAPAPWVHRVLLQPGMGIVANNTVHERSAFADTPAHPRLLYRARYLDRVQAADAWVGPVLQAGRAPLQVRVADAAVSP